MNRQMKPPIEHGITFPALALTMVAPVELFGHVTLAEGYALPGFLGCHALVALRDTPDTSEGRYGRRSISKPSRL